MSHLSVERIAALVDESPTPAEISHFASCADCGQERARFASLAGLAKTVPVIAVPITSWERLAPALRAEGLIGRPPAIVGDGAPRAQPAVRSRPRQRGWLQAAAAVLLVTGGMVAGRVTAGASVLPNELGHETDGSPQFTSVAEAEQARATANRVLRAAGAYLVSADPVAMHAVTPRTLNSRLESLTATIQALSANLHETHNDPVLSSIRETTKAEYDATIRQMNTARPTSLTMTVY